MSLLQCIVKIIFSRVMVAVVSLLLPLFLLILFLILVPNSFFLIFILFMILNLFVIIYVLNTNVNPTYKIAWLSFLFLFPIFGVCFYLMLHLPLLYTKLNDRMIKIHSYSKKYLNQNQRIMEELSNQEIYHFAYYMYQVGQFPIYSQTDSHYFSTGHRFYTDLLEELRDAKDFIFLEYFIIEKSMMWDSILEILKQKAANGVEVRILYDGICSIFLLPYSYPKKLKKMGLKCKVVFPLKPIFSTRENYRDHRKICVIDGRIAYTGGINIADEYINYKEKFGYWKDIAVKIEGSAVNTLTVLFLEMWNLEETTLESYQKYLVENIGIKKTIPGYVIPYADHPFDQETLGKNVYLDMIYAAHFFIHIMTPYLILDYEFLNSLCYCAKKGIEVKIILPHIPDKKIVHAIGCSYYLELIEAGIEIYEYMPGFCHAKLMISDLNRGAIGSINLDYRSFYLNFENGIYFYQHPIISEMETDFQSTLKKCQKITRSSILKHPWWKRLLGRILRIFSPFV